ncbi:MAG TPA: kelch repeat-containing protein [Armatimonadota bacterium]|nr:kelch repeat-containing protein [Armatimonadota bacterium]
MKIILLAMILTATGHAEWRTGPPMPSARDHLGCGMVEGMFVVAGGAYWENDTKHYSAETIAYSPSTKKWVRLPYLPIPGAYGASAVIDGQLVIAGGANEKGALNDCFRLVKERGKFVWKRLPDLPRPLFGAQGAAIGSKFYVVGGAPGMDEVGIVAAKPKMLVLDLNSRKWKEYPSPSGRVGSAVASVGNKLFVFGGYGYHDGVLSNFGDAWVYQNRSWKRLKDIPNPARWSAALALDNRHIGLFGGYGEGFLDKVWIYDVETDTYAPAPPLPLPVATMSAGLNNGTIYLAGGEDLQRHRTDKLFIGRISAVGTPGSPGTPQ